MVLLIDDRALQPPESVVPWCARLTTADLVQRNKAVELEGLTPEAAAARWSEDA